MNQGKPIANKRADQIYAEQDFVLAIRTDRMFALLLMGQWFVGLTFAWFVSPLTWHGAQSSVHAHVYAAGIIGGLLTSFPVFLVWQSPGRVLNRHVIAVAQMCYSALFVHLTGGRIETHFHIFGSLAFLAIYRDRNVLITATLTSLLDHVLRGFYAPASIYGVASVDMWRAVEHVAWVIFEDVFLIYSIFSARAQARLLATHQADLEASLTLVEEKVRQRTAELSDSQDMVLTQQQSLIDSAKNAALGEMAGQVAHEINTPLAAIVLTAQGLQKKAGKDAVTAQDVQAKMEFILQITHKLGRIINSMRKLAGHGYSEQITEVSLKSLVDDVLLLCEGRFRKSGIEFRFENLAGEDSRIQCRANEISQVLINLLNNAHDAVASGGGEKWVLLTIASESGTATFQVTDSGLGIPEEVSVRLFTPKFTTKTLDHGTGFGLSISKRLIERHGGRIYLDRSQRHTAFVFEIPLEQIESITRAAGGYR